MASKRLSDAKKVRLIEMGTPKRHLSRLQHTWWPVGASVLGASSEGAGPSGAPGYHVVIAAGHEQHAAYRPGAGFVPFPSVTAAERSIEEQRIHWGVLPANAHVEECHHDQ